MQPLRSRSGPAPGNAGNAGNAGNITIQAGAPSAGMLHFLTQTETKAMYRTKGIRAPSPC
jgi:hypothetical protein